MNVTLLHVTPEYVVNRAVGKPYNSKPSLELTKKVICIKKHLSCAEHIVFNFEIEGISRFILQELARHRMASMTVESTRYTLQKALTEGDLSKLFNTPDLSELDIDIAAEIHASLSFAQSMFVDVLRKLKKIGVPNDYIKYLLPESWKTNLSLSINLRSLINFLELRLSPQAHFEIVELARKMVKAIDNYHDSYASEILHLYFKQNGFIFRA